MSVFTRPTPPASSTAGPGRRLSILAVPEGAEQQIDILKKKIEEMVVPISLAYYFKTISNQHSVGHVKYRIELGIILIVLIAKVNLDIFKNFATFYPNNLFSFD